MSKGFAKKAIAIAFVGVMSISSSLFAATPPAKVETPKTDKTVQKEASVTTEKVIGEGVVGEVTNMPVPDGKIVAGGLPKFETLYAKDKLKDFKVGYAKTSLEMLDQAVAFLPENLKKELFTSKGIVEFKGPIYEYNFQASSKREKPSKIDNFEMMTGAVTFYDDPKYLHCETELSLVFKIGKDKQIQLSDEAKGIIGYIIEDYTPDEIEAAMNGVIANKGKANYLVEEKNRKVTIMSSTTEKTGTRVQLNFERRKDYP